MAIKLLMGNAAMGYGALAAGVGFVSGYPGTPSSEVLETVAAKRSEGVYIEWSVNEKAALEAAAGAAYSGMRALVTMKQVGLNVASDPLMSLAYVGVKGGLVVLAADDPGPISSQTEQDTRRFAAFCGIPVFDPATPEEAYAMIQTAFDVSERYGVPVLFRPTTRVCHAYASVDVTAAPPRPAEGFCKSSRWVIFPKLARENHRVRLESLQAAAEEFSGGAFNPVSGAGTLGIAASGIAYAYAADAVKKLNAPVKLWKVDTPFPFPERRALDFLSGTERVLTVEELSPVLEENLLQLIGKRHLQADVSGRLTGAFPVAGEYDADLVLRAVADFCGIPLPARKALPAPPAPAARPPVLCAGCPHRASFYAVKTAMKGRKAIFTGDIGCYTLGNAQPLDMVDTCLCMGAGVTVAQGLVRANPGTKLLAFIGDSTFFHTGIPGVVNAVYNGADVTVVVLDNSTTAMTGHQPHPGTGVPMTGTAHPGMDVAAVLTGIGVQKIETADPLDLPEAVAAVRRAAEYTGVSAVLFRSPCIQKSKHGEAYTVSSACTGCKKCIRELGCPALFVRENHAEIDPTLCTGCGLCAALCPAQAMKKEKRDERI